MDQEPNQERPIYETVSYLGDEEQWDADIPFRQKRMEEIVAKVVGRNQELDEEGRGFAQNTLIEIQKISSSKFSKLDPSKVPVEVDLVCNWLGEYLITQEPELEQREHTKSTLKAANVVLNALTPELGLDIHDDLKSAKKKADIFVERGLADVSEDWQVLFSTVLPGIYISFSQLEDDDDPDKMLKISVSALKSNLPG